MANPSTPVTASTQIPPPVINLPIGTLQGSSVVMTPTFFQFLQLLYASLQGNGGVIDTPVNISAGAGIALDPSPLRKVGSVGLAPIPSDTLLANLAADDEAPTAVTLTALLDTLGAAEGDLLYRAADAWQALVAGDAGEVLQTQGAGADPVWVSISDLLDLLGATEGDILYRDAAGWQVLGPGIAGQVLVTNGAAAAPSWGVGSSATTFAGLPATPSDGQRGFITDGSVAAAGNFGTAAAGGGANHVPVYWNGALTSWRIG